MKFYKFKFQHIFYLILMFFLTACDDSGIDFENNKRSLFQFEITDTNNSPLSSMLLQNIVSDASDTKIIGEATTSAAGTASMTTLIPETYNANVLYVNGFLSDPNSINSPIPVDRSLTTSVILNNNIITTNTSEIPTIALTTAGFLTIQLNNTSGIDAQIVAEVDFSPATQYLILENGTLSVNEPLQTENSNTAFVNQDPNQSVTIRTTIPSVTTLKITSIVNNVTTVQFIDIPVTQTEQTHTYEY